MRVYSFRTNLVLEDIAKAYGFRGVSEFVRECIHYYIKHNKVDDEVIEEAKTMLEIEDLYRKYMKIRRVLSTQRAIKSVVYMLGREGIDYRVQLAIKELLRRKVELEKKLVEKIIDEVLEDVEKEEGIRSE